LLQVERARFLLFGILLLSSLGILSVLPFAAMSVDVWSFNGVFALAGLLAAVSLYCRYRSMAQLASMLELMSCGILLSIPALIASYLAMSLGHPLVDAKLKSMDFALGFHWKEFLLFIDSNAIVAKLLFAAYVSFPYQLLVIPCVLVLLKKYARAYCMVAGYGIICFVSAGVSIWYPALSAYSAYGIDPSSLHNINSHFGYAFLEQFKAVSNGHGFVLSKENAEGIVTFPSVHAAVAALCIWALWTARYLRYPFLILNTAMAIAAISHGSHYLVDIIAGIGVAGISIAMVNLYAGEYLVTAGAPCSPDSSALQQ
jgi:hypothetical protein